MIFGVHVHVAAGYRNAVTYAERVGCRAVQFFSGNPKTYRTAGMDEAAVASFRQGRSAAGIETSVIHSPYLINLASDDRKITAGSLHLLKNDFKVADAGGVRYVNTHLGSYGTRPRAEGFKAVVAALATALEFIPPQVMLVLENSAGAGQLCGGTMEELGALLRALDHPQLGVCIDTAHAWAAGYDIDSQAGVDRFVDLVATEISLEKLLLFHFNDTQVPLGGHRDRHWHIGEGLIGFGGFRAIALRPELRGRPAILETPGEEADDLRNLQTIRAIFEGAHEPAPR
ncbi:MAG: deoxyribonuclease IV [Candidatus Eremiobacteraeota bacterium]|nr:deoxyribonuclease IV [Candidatus Eremiobacteraeota bacterium]